jgi:hypothetical protein
MDDDGRAPAAAAARFFDEPKREVDDDRLDIYERAATVLNELKDALPSAIDDIERLMERIKAAYWEVCGVPENEQSPQRTKPPEEGWGAVRPPAQADCPSTAGSSAAHGCRRVHGRPCPDLWGRPGDALPDAGARLCT